MKKGECSGQCQRLDDVVEAKRPTQGHDDGVGELKNPSKDMAVLCQRGSDAGEHQRSDLAVV